jgi:predicted nucleic-acid-binding Zn-ribbon protein
MNDPDLEKRMSELSDVDIVRLLTIDAKEHSPEVLAAAEAEAHRRGVPIDEAFIPPAAGERATTAQPSRFEAGGKPIACAHCGNELFETREILLNTRGLTFLKLDWLNRSATALGCANCGLVQLFSAPPEALDGGS